LSLFAIPLETVEPGGERLPTGIQALSKQKGKTPPR